MKTKLHQFFVNNEIDQNETKQTPLLIPNGWIKGRKPRNRKEN